MSDDLDLRAVHRPHEPDPEFRAALRAHVAQIVAADRSALPVAEGSVAEVLELERRPRRTPRRRSALLLAAAAAAAVLAIAVVTIPSDDAVVSNTGPASTGPPTDPTTTSSAVTAPSGGPAFAAAMEASGLLTSPTADEVAQAMDGGLFRAYTGDAVVSGDWYVSLRTCHQDWGLGPCSRGWAFLAGRVDGTAEVHRGLLDLAGQFVSVHPVDDRYFVALQDGPDGQAPTARMIDAVSGKAGPLVWSEAPTTLTAPEQALLLLSPPMVVDARDGTIRPMALPDGAATASSVAQQGAGRVWVVAGPDGGPFGLVHSDDGGATWTEVVLPARLRTKTDDLAVAAAGDRVAVTSGWVPDGMPVYVSDDAGRTWTAVTPSEPATGNLSHLYVLADGRLVLVWSNDAHAAKVLVSTRSDWTAFESVDVPYLYFGVNAAGIAVGETFGLWDDDRQLNVKTIEFSTDLKTWRPIEGLND